MSSACRTDRHRWPSARDCRIGSATCKPARASRSPRRRFCNKVRVLQFLSVILTALAFVPGGAHLFELPKKIGLSQERYVVVQSIYRGWALFGVVIFAAIDSNLLLAVKQWPGARSYRLT